jgi:hypothetical protein
MVTVISSACVVQYARGSGVLHVGTIINAFGVFSGQIDDGESPAPRRPLCALVPLFASTLLQRS